MESFAAVSPLIGVRPKRRRLCWRHSAKRIQAPAHSQHLPSSTDRTAHQTAMESTIMRNTLLSRRALVAGAGALSISLAHADEAPHKETPAGAGQSPGPESWVSSLALQAASYAVPIVAMYNLRQTTSVGPHAKVPPNEIWRIDEIASPTIAEQAGYVTPNVNVIYGFGFMDL